MKTIRRKVFFVKRNHVQTSCVYEIYSTYNLYISVQCSKNIYQNTAFFPGPQAFCKKAVERVRSEKNILNTSVEWSGWSGFF